MKKSEIQDGLCVVFCPHTTAGITINENADPAVQHDLLLGLSKVFPDRPEFRHMEGNSAAHLKSSCMGASTTVIIENGQLVLEHGRAFISVNLTDPLAAFLCKGNGIIFRDCFLF
ncbi:secondary thiamine-phosphate synthase enzyme YjbQ [Brucepastera parasyntrophica]|uniref:secondary thiamine-phosphate synthase enzyme YjbQ n=1 Tax=Brucepastera parasyntrophica TaxID=2880008 RepID=UPI0021095C58|nr:secondary thiamine-phosphate synthase enzyme YjbQ [Brucepastera parasyntrophica]ULQ58448.1 secondary thiamine-phosphate synthase enzyme YjbQ [Brucepastera parasyntrophica]